MVKQYIHNNVCNVECIVQVYLSLIRKAIRADNAFIVLDRGLRVAWFVLAPEIHVVEPKPLRESFIPLKVVQEGPGCVTLHIHPIFECCKKSQENQANNQQAAA